MAGSRQQFNVTLDSDLVRRVKHHAIDTQRSLSDLVGHVLKRHLEEDTVMTPTPSTGLRLQPMVHVQKMDAAVAFYEALGATVRHGSRDGDFVMLGIGDSELALLAHPPNPEQNEGTVELNFDTTGDLDDLQKRLIDAGVRVITPVTDEGFGRQLQVATPDGLLVKINHLEPDLYT